MKKVVISCAAQDVYTLIVMKRLVRILILVSFFVLAYEGGAVSAEAGEQEIPGEKSTVSLTAQGNSSEHKDAAENSAWSRNVNLFYGLMDYFVSDTFPGDNQVSVGVKFDIGKKESTVHAVTALFYSSDSSEQETRRSTEFDLGLRKIFGHRRFHPYIEAGIAAYKRYFNHVETMSGDIVDSSREKLSPWLGTGGYVMLGKNFNIGLSVSGSSLGAHYGLLTGYCW